MRRPDDREFIRTVHHQALHDVVLAQFGAWDEALQDRFFERGWASGQHLDVIFVDGTPCGYVAVDDEPGEVHVRQLMILPEHQCHGIGTHLIRRACERAARRDVPVRLGCLRRNRAAELYRRLGFRQTAEKDEWLFFEWSPRRDTIERCRAAHRRLFTTLDGIGDDLARRPSRLPGWTVGHVLTHLARNAESHVRILEAAARDQAVEQYAGGHEQRAADIEAGAGRPAAALAADVRDTTLVLEATWESVPPETWDRAGLARGEPWPCRLLPFHRWREIEVHHVDLGLGYDVTDWPAAYVARELPAAVATIPDRLPDPATRARPAGRSSRVVCGTASRRR